jgi:hypothetical protein
MKTMNQEGSLHEISSFDAELLVVRSNLPNKTTTMNPMEQIRRPGLSQHPIVPNEIENLGTKLQKPVLRQESTTRNTIDIESQATLRQTVSKRGARRRRTIVAETEGYIDSINRRLEE